MVQGQFLPEAWGFAIACHRLPDLVCCFVLGFFRFLKNCSLFFSETESETGIDVEVGTGTGTGVKRERGAGVETAAEKDLNEVADHPKDTVAEEASVKALLGKWWNIALLVVWQILQHSIRMGVCISDCSGKEKKKNSLFSNQKKKLFIYLCLL